MPLLPTYKAWVQQLRRFDKMDLLVFLQSAWTVAVMILFLGIVIWAYSSRNKKDFDEASRLVLDEEEDNIEKR
ncbi:cbb3-type cytochrome c oxidase subunit 3 [Candidatus Albibeggiatoa sp. nov. BB20]|uniref:cbb3-type cytochrome oxidase subunit 3 n=1 Tax=Candidatus Albibeggiatoa sp. nov. BB20 TaxID=3162723 RepID=UPI0033657F0A